MNYDKLILGKCIMTETEALNKIKLYASQIFAQTDAESQISLDISQSDSPLIRGNEITNRQYSPYLQNLKLDHHDQNVTLSQQSTFKKPPTRLTFDEQKQQEPETVRIVKKQYPGFANANYLNHSSAASKKNSKPMNRFVKWKQPSSSNNRFQTYKLRYSSPYSIKSASNPNSLIIGVRTSPKQLSTQNPQLIQTQMRQKTQEQNVRQKYMQDARRRGIENEKKKDQIRASKDQKLRSDRKLRVSKALRYSQTKQTARYLQQKPIMSGYSDYINQNVYGRMRTETQYRKPERYGSTSRDPQQRRQERQKSWNSFIEKSNQWQMEKQRKNVQKRLQQARQIRQAHKVERIYTKQIEPPTVQEYLKRIKRQTLNLKEKLKGVEFRPNVQVYQTRSRKKHRSPVYMQSRLIADGSNCIVPPQNNGSVKLQNDNRNVRLQNDNRSVRLQNDNRIRINNAQEIEFIMGRNY